MLAAEHVLRANANIPTHGYTVNMLYLLYLLACQHLVISMVVQWLGLFPQGKTVLGLNPAGGKFFFAHSPPRISMSFLQVPHRLNMLILKSVPLTEAPIWSQVLGRFSFF